jgi:undecaprenyl pyrophosphate synthase
MLYIIKRKLIKFYLMIFKVSFWRKDNFIKRSPKEINFLIKLIREKMQEFANDPTIKKHEVNIKFYGLYDKVFDKTCIIIENL